jgi:integrase
MPVRNLTDLTVRAIKPPANGQEAHWDEKLKGFGLRVSQGGSKTWVITYRHNGRMRWLKLGSCPVLSLAEAREQAKSKLADVQKGVDVASAKKAARDADSFAELCDRYLNEHARPKKKPGSAYEDKRIINRELLPKWGGRKAHEITRKNVIELINRIAMRSDKPAPVVANRTLALISTIFNFGVDNEIVESNPAARVRKPGVEHQRDRVLNEDEIRRVWGALEAETGQTRSIFRLALLTAQRKGEIVGMKKDELDLDAGWWTIAAERTKNGLAHRVPLTPQATQILLEMNAAAGEERLIFRGGRIGRPLTNLQKPIRRIKKESKVDFRIHDLRRTAASLMTGIGIPRLVVSKLLNHVERGITAVYDRHSYDAEKRASLLRWERRLVEIISGEAQRTSVIELRAS